MTHKKPKKLYLVRVNDDDFCIDYYKVYLTEEDALDQTPFEESETFCKARFERITGICLRPNQVVEFIVKAGKQVRRKK